MTGGLGDRAPPAVSGVQHAAPQDGDNHRKKHDNILR
jgi:hypothetical protein